MSKTSQEARRKYLTTFELFKDGGFDHKSRRTRGLNCTARAVVVKLTLRRSFLTINRAQGLKSFLVNASVNVHTRKGCERNITNGR